MPEDTTLIEVRLEGDDDESGNGTLTVSGDLEILAACMLLIAAMLANEESDVVSLDAPDEPDLAESA